MSCGIECPAPDDIYLPCEACRGDGWILDVDHGPDCFSDESCAEATAAGTCPQQVQVPCRSCGGRG